MNHPEPLAAAHETARPRRWRKWLILTAVVILGAGLSAALYFYSEWSARKQLREVIAETDRLDPGWRLEDLLAQRCIIPDEQNGALRVLAAAQQLPNPWSTAGTEQLLQGVVPERQLSKGQTAALSAELGKVPLALAEARKLADLPDGRYPINWGKYAAFTPARHVQDARRVASLLTYDVRLRAQDGDTAGALLSCRATLNAGRSLGDEPWVIGTLIRIAVRSVAVGNLERTLAQGEPPAAGLESFEALIEDEDAQPLLLIAARGERALSDQLMQGLESGQLKPTGLLGTLKQANLDFRNLTWDQLQFWLLPGSISRLHASTQERLNAMVEAARLPESEQKSRFEELEAAHKNESPFLRGITPVPSMVKIAKLDRRSHALLRSATAALAAERYRRKYGHWPESLAALVPALLRQVPTDPYDGVPLRFRRLPDGLVIYSVGADGQDNGGNVGVYTPGGDTGIRLWDVARRRQPADPPKPESTADKLAPRARSR